MALEPPLTEVGGKVYLVGGVAKPVLLRRENGKGVELGWSERYVHGILLTERLSFQTISLV